MAEVPDRSKLLVAAAFHASNLLVLALAVVGSPVLALLVSPLLGWLVGIGGLVLYATRVSALAGDRDFAARALAAGSPARRALPASSKMKILREFGKLPPAWKTRVERLEVLGREVEGRLEKGAGSYLDAALGDLAPRLRLALDEAAGLLEAGAKAARAGTPDPKVEAELDKVAGVLESMKSDLIQMEGGSTALPGDRVVGLLEDLSGEVQVLRQAVTEVDKR